MKKIWIKKSETTKAKMLERRGYSVTIVTSNSMCLIKIFRK